LYDTTAEAEAARQRLASALDVSRVKVIDQQSHGSGQGLSLSDYHMSQDDRHAYGEGLRRGGALLCAEVHGHEDADRIVQLLEETSSVDLDQRQQSWRQEGWAPQQAAGTSALGAQGAASTSTTARSGTVEEERIPIVEEELRVGKREVERGGARVRSYIREIPVHEEVTLREEHVQVERRPVAAGTTATGTGTGTGTGAGVIGSAAASADALRERTIDMVEKAEEAVVQKVANVREEVVVSKTVEERTQQIEDTVRRTEVEIEDGGAGERSAFSGFGSGSDSTGDQNRR
jgi:stress response protein YsnF